MSSDWQYIEDHMGGHDEDGLSNFMSEPSFYEKSSQKKPIKRRKALSIIDSVDIGSVAHMTHIDNLSSILKYGLLPHNNKYKKVDISNQEVNSRRNKIEPIYGRNLHDYVPLYFNIRNAMLYRNQKMFDDNIIILIFHRDLLFLENSIFTNGNAALDDVWYSNEIEDLLHKEWDWDKIWSRSWYNYGDDVKRSMMAELLIYEKLELTKLIDIYCLSVDAKKYIEKNYNINTCKVSINSHEFF